MEDRLRHLEGLGIRVLVNGYWGFAATARREPEEIDRAARLRRGRHGRLPPADGAGAPRAGQSPPRAGTRRCRRTRSTSRSRRRCRCSWRRPGGCNRCGAGVRRGRHRPVPPPDRPRHGEGTAIDERRSSRAPASRRPRRPRRAPTPVVPELVPRPHLGGGVEHQRLGLIEADTATKRLSSVGEGLPSEVTTLVIDSGQVELQIHESIGHPVELDRVLGMEEAYAELLVREARRPREAAVREPARRPRPTRRSPEASGRSAGTTRVPAQRMPIIEDGVFQNFISSRETASVLGLPSSGAMRADGWAHPYPLIRMTNISIEPREGRSPTSSAMKGRRVHEHEHVVVDRRPPRELPVRLRDRMAHQGQQAHRDVRNPNYTGITTEFWESCDAVGGREEWTVWGTPNCGKGQPGQVARVGHGASPAQFGTCSSG